MTTKTKKLTGPEVDKLFGPGCDSVSVKNGVYTLRRAYYYRPANAAGKTLEVMECFEAGLKRIEAAGFKVTVLDHGDKWAPFRGGDTVAQGSHYWVKLTLSRD